MLGYALTGLKVLSLGFLLLAFASLRARQVPQKYPRFFPGARWVIAYGRYMGVERFAVDEAQRLAQTSFPYVIDCEPASGLKPEEQEHLILVGTEKDNPLIRALIQRGVLKRPSGPQGYSIAGFDSPWKKGQRVIALAGYDPNGVLYGAEDFNSQIVSRAAGFQSAVPDPSIDDRRHKAFDGIPDFAMNETPAIQNRGIWCWGYVIYDYRRFFDHMARLKMNTIIFWNDVVPQNCRAVIEYAHSRGIRVILGFEWGYGIAGLDPTSAQQRAKMRDEVAATFKSEYRGLGMDGIYFQTFTENSNLTIKGKSTAEWACQWVNEISSALFKIAPDLRIEFGLHATSIRDHYVDLKPLDPRIVITWEDAGTLPFSYDPVTPEPSAFDATVDYAKKLAVFRSNRELSMVAKGWIQLPWQTSEHHGPYILGERDPEWIRQRLTRRQDRWDYVNSLWLKNFPLAAQFYRSMLGQHPAVCSVTGLIEDGEFEERIQPSVALFAQTLWDPNLPDAEISRRASSPYYRR
ncbi:MAG TPA: hypothetical protein VMI31_06045 [Fimbriimonadaceae bacterium]|nr:hypothetical protein [Fimbriimonadaceae bacterium]